MESIILEELFRFSSVKAELFLSKKRQRWDKEMFKVGSF